MLQHTTNNNTVTQFILFYEMINVENSEEYVVDAEDKDALSCWLNFFEEGIYKYIF